MEIQIDFDSDEALYIQLRNQIIYGIATRQYQEGDSLPSVRSLADTIGINMHTVNKAYAVLRQEGLLRLGRRTGAVIAIDLDKIKAMEEMKDHLRLAVARGFCKGVTREEAHQLVDEIYSDYE
ncbi:MAG: GntR family transcriptional regulator [Clostridiales bacterium]|nr:GntR family transcriptional regulator [Clostridiales bacterium]